MPQSGTQFLDLVMQFIGKVIEIIGPIWPIIAFLIKIWIYVIYFIPMLGMKLLKYLNLWPNVWPLN